jgi:hypothetical protein
MTSRKALSSIGVLALLTIVSLGAYAQCGGVDQHGKLKPQAFHGSGIRSGSLVLAYQSENHSNDGEGIVGFWRVTLISKGNTGLGIPDGTILDHGFAQWHSDGTEIMNSSRVPNTGSFCLGVWKKVGPSQYKLNHFALSFDDTVHLGYANIREDVTLSQDSDSFSGTFSLAAFDGQGNAGPVLTGDITATRIKVSTTLQDIL